MRSKQEIFTLVKDHLLTQNAQASGYKGCLYLTEGGLKCAVGCLIPKGVYSPALEHANPWSQEGMVTSCKDAWRRVHVAVPELRAYEPMLQSMQVIHDNNTLPEWPELLRDLARRHGLSY